MDKEQKRAAKAHFVAQIQAGQPWYVAAARAGLPISRSTAYRLLQVYASQGEAALQDGRHGHSSKLRGDARTFLQDYCRHAPGTPSSVIQTLLQERFGVNVSISQVNRVRAALGISNHPESRLQEKKRQKRKSLFLRGSGRKGQGRSCFWLLLIRRMSSLS